MTPVWGFNGIVAAFVSQMLGETFPNGVGMAVADRNGNLVAGVLFHNWHPKSGVIEVSAAALDPRWATRTVLREGFKYVFEDAGAQMAIARTTEDNTRTRRLWKAMGAQEHIIPRLRGREVAEVLLTLTDDDWFSSRFAKPIDAAEPQPSGPLARDAH